MSLRRTLLAMVATSFLVGFACTPSNNATRAPSSGGDSSTEATRDLAPPLPVTQSAPPDVTQDPGSAYDAPPTAPLAVTPPPPVMARPVYVPQPAGPYRVRIVDERSHDLPRYYRDGRAYVMGTVGSRYSVVVSNPTAQRVEAVVSVDGLDAMDGHPANYVTKRGYILAPYGDMTVDGFRTSYEEVATFRFSSVADSYAGRLGQARDVGVIGVAFFAERPQVAVVEPPAETVRRMPSHHYPLPSRPQYQPPARSAASEPPPAPPPAASPPPSPTAAPSFDDISPAPLAQNSGGGGGAPQGRLSIRQASPPPASPKAAERPGLGTEFGEARESHIGTTWFDRANQSQPTQVVAFRYNNRAGLEALGIVIPRPYVDPDLRVRETAEPFRENRFAQAPP